MNHLGQFCRTARAESRLRAGRTGPDCSAAARAAAIEQGGRKHVRWGPGPQFSLLDAFEHVGATAASDEVTDFALRCSHPAGVPPGRVSFLRTPPAACWPGAAAFTTADLCGTQIACAQVGRKGQLLCGSSPRQGVAAQRRAIMTPSSWAAAIEAVRLGGARSNGGARPPQQPPHRCGYWFIRRPFQLRGDTILVDMSARGQHWSWTAVPLALVAQALRRIAQKYAIPCIEVNHMEFYNNHTLHRNAARVWSIANATLGTVLGNRTQIGKRSREYGTRANARELHAAATAPLFIGEIGSMWPDLVLAKRCRAGKPSAMLVLSGEGAPPGVSNPECGSGQFVRGAEVPWKERNTTTRTCGRVRQAPM